MKDHCQRIKEMAANPKDTITDMTVREALGLKEHIKTCWQCDSITQAITDSQPIDKYKPNWEKN